MRFTGPSKALFTLSLFLLCAGTGAGEQPSAAELIDQLIADAPPAGNEFTWTDREHAVEHPAAAALREAIHENRLTNEQWAALFEATGVFRMRERWRMEDPLVVHAMRPSWLDEDGCITIKAELADAQPIVLFRGACLCANGNDYLRGRGALHGAGRLEPGQTKVTFSVDVDVRRRLSDDEALEKYLRDPRLARHDPVVLVHDDPVVLWHGVIDKTIEPVRSREATMTPVATPELTEGIRKSLTLLVGIDDADAANYIWASGELDDSLMDQARSLGLPLLIDVLDETGAIVRQMKINLNGSPGRPYTYDRAPLPFDAEDAESASTYTVRIHTDLDKATFQVQFDEYWAGSISIPLSEVPSRRGS